MLVNWSIGQSLYWFQRRPTFLWSLKDHIAFNQIYFIKSCLFTAILNSFTNTGCLFRSFEGFAASCILLFFWECDRLWDSNA